jgi:Tfp pilus assembly protein PilN
LGTLVKNGTESWVRNIEEMIVDLKRQQIIAQRRIQEARQWTADNQIATYENVYRQVIQDAREEKGMLPDVYYVVPDKEKQDGKPKPEQQ